jgi:hypothetical protein
LRFLYARKTGLVQKLEDRKYWKRRQWTGVEISVMDLYNQLVK